MSVCLWQTRRWSPVSSAFGGLVWLWLAEDAEGFTSTAFSEPPLLHRCSGCRTMSEAGRGGLAAVEGQAPFKHGSHPAPLPFSESCWYAEEQRVPSISIPSWKLGEWKAAWWAMDFSMPLHDAACACIVQQCLAGWVVWGYVSSEVPPSDCHTGCAPEEIIWSISLLCGWRSLPFSDQLLSVFPVTLSLFLRDVWMVLDSSYDNCRQFDNILESFAYFYNYTSYISDDVLLYF